MDSIHADKHKSRHTSVQTIKIDVKKPKQIVLVQPLLEKDESGRYSHKHRKYVDMNAMKHGRIDKRMIIDPILTDDILVSSLCPATIKLDGHSLTSMKINDMPI